MSEEYATPDEEQSAFDVEFTWIVECQQAFDDVIEKLAAVGLVVEPRQLSVVARWLDMFSSDSPLPLGHRVAMLRGMLAASDG